MCIYTYTMLNDNHNGERENRGENARKQKNRTEKKKWNERLLIWVFALVYK